MKFRPRVWGCYSAMKRREFPSLKRYPVVFGILRWLRTRLVSTSAYDHTVWLAALMPWFFLLRIGELLGHAGAAYLEGDALDWDHV